jgi:hypothetical protein
VAEQVRESSGTQELLAPADNELGEVGGLSADAATGCALQRATTSDGGAADALSTRS